MSKKDWGVVRDIGRVIAGVAIAHGVSSKQWSNWHSFGLTLWMIGETGSLLS